VPEFLIETSALRKEYRTRRGRQVAVDGLDLAVPVGGVHGFLGPNGSGKTTTIRMVLGLASADAGSIRLFGEPVPDRLPFVIDRVGAVVEQPRLFPGFTGRQNLQLLGRAIGVTKDRVDRALELVGMRGRADDRYKAYSLGMKQRLAIAAALLKTPDLLVLDEPTNGLDPAGIREIRNLVRDLAASGTTVMISSHILAEVQQVCDSVSIIGRGRLLAGGSVDEVLSRVGGSGTPAYRVAVDNHVGAAEVLTAAGFGVQVDHDGLRVSGAPAPSAITEVLATHGYYLSGLSPVGDDLESAFLEITEGAGL
jgi:ABC-2 type transport system ATP-binding protein